MKRSVRVQFWLETILGSVTGLLFLVTVIRRDWVEGVFGWDPDQHSGAVEWLIVGGLFVVTAALSSAARLEWQRAATTAGRLPAHESNSRCVWPSIDRRAYRVVVSRVR